MKTNESLSLSIAQINQTEKRLRWPINMHRLEIILIDVRHSKYELYEFAMVSSWCQIFEGLKITKTLDFFLINGYNSKTTRPIANFTFTKMKEHKTSRRTTYLKVRIGLPFQPHRIFKYRQFLQTWRKSELCSLVGHKKPPILLLTPIIVANWLKNEIGKVSS